ncbi:putative transmembrane protein [Toxoplasma gondii VAND]|uniref:Putative transmembrane protein n=1 Tax=Toxoplasma gondii VAND TaxID=933077 RepID=A0A086PSP9_TOXGO|nr:putative transmembrane protein [Toxoplasma gondii VAND]
MFGELCVELAFPFLRQAVSVMLSRASLGRPGVPRLPGRPVCLLLFASLCSCLVQKCTFLPVSAFRRSEGNLSRGLSAEQHIRNKSGRRQLSEIDGGNHFDVEPASFLGLLGESPEDADSSSTKAEDSDSEGGTSPAATEDQNGNESDSQQSESSGAVEKRTAAKEAPEAQPEKQEEPSKNEAQEAKGTAAAASRQDDTVIGEGKNPEELTDDDFKQMSTSQGLSILFSQGKGMMQEVQHTLDGVNAVVSITELMGKVREDIRKDVEALNHTVTEEYQNIEQLRQLQDAQTAVLRSQLNYLIPLNRQEAAALPEMPGEVLQSGSSSLSFYSLFGSVCAAVVAVLLSAAHVSS